VKNKIDWDIELRKNSDGVYYSFFRSNIDNLREEDWWYISEQATAIVMGLADPVEPL